MENDFSITWWLSTAVLSHCKRTWFPLSFFIVSHIYRTANSPIPAKNIPQMMSEPMWGYEKSQRLSNSWESQRQPPCNSVMPLPLIAGWRRTGSAMRGCASALSRPHSLGQNTQRQRQHAATWATNPPWSNHRVWGMVIHLWWVYNPTGHDGRDYLRSFFFEKIITFWPL